MRVPDNYLAIPTNWIQVALVPSLLGGDYQTHLCGTSVGPFELAIEGLQDGGVISRDVFAGRVIADQQLTTTTAAMADSGSLVLLSGPLTSAPMVTDVTVSPTTAQEGQEITLQARIIDPDAGESHVASIDWGDGESDTLSLDANVLSFSRGHQYVNNRPGNAPYTITVTVTDKDGGTSEPVSQTFTVANVPPTATPDSYAVDEDNTTECACRAGVLSQRHRSRCGHR